MVEGRGGENGLPRRGSPSEEPYAREPEAGASGVSGGEVVYHAGYGGVLTARVFHAPRGGKAPEQRLSVPRHGARGTSAVLFAPPLTGAFRMVTSRAGAGLVSRDSATVRLSVRCSKAPTVASHARGGEVGC